MTLATGDRPTPRAFTLLEILVVVALIGLLSTVLVSGAGRLLQRGPVTPEQAFWQIVAAARRHALQQGVEVRVAFDEKTKAITARAPDGGTVAEQPLPEGIQVEFIAGASGGPAMLLAGERVETAVVPRVRFYPDGTCMPFRVQLRGRTGVLRVLSIDPWTCAPVITAAKEAR